MGKKGLLGAFKAVLGVSACITKTPWAHAGACMRAGAGAGAGVRGCARVCAGVRAYTYREDPPHAKKLKGPFLFSCHNPLASCRKVM
jgi:hypothetical protein